MRNRTAVKSITQAQYYQLVGLRAAADLQRKVLDAITAAAWEITQESEDGKPEKQGHTMDFMWASREQDEFLDILGIAVEPPK